MRVSWILNEHVKLDPLADIEAMKNVGSFWGSWRTWRAYQTDNVICHEQKRADEFLKRNFQNTCNFYIPNHVYTALGRPDRVKLYNGEFKDDIVQSEDIVAMHLTSSISDLVLLLGFDLGDKPKNPDKLSQHRAVVYLSMIKKVMVDHPQVQYVLIDHANPIGKEFANLPNLTCDSLENALELATLD